MIAVVTPVLDDWASLQRLLSDLAAQVSVVGPMDVFVVDDGSTTPAELEPAEWSGLGAVTIIHCGTNLGHQRAIAVGITHVVAMDRFSHVIVMDADGEDRPQDLPSLWEQVSANDKAGSAGSIVVAQRASRSEGMGFRVFYRLYRWLFHLLTGQRLDFGNYCVLPATAATRLTYMPELWNHFPASIMRSRVPVTKVPVHRGHRYEGRSRMRFPGLVNHGLAAMSTYTDVVFARLLIVVVALFTACLLLGALGLGIRAFTDLPVPGWTTVGLGLALLGLLAFLSLLAVMTFILLSARSNVPSTPRTQAPTYVAGITVLRRA